MGAYLGGTMFDVIIRGGTIVSLDGEAKGDVAIRDGKIADILTDGVTAEATRVIDAQGLHLFPGLIDAHVHFGFGEPVTEYTTETIYAAQGGFTTILAFLLNNEPYGDVFTREIEYAKSRAYVDYGLHFSTASPLHIEELPQYVEKLGVTSFKYFMNFKGEEGRYLGLDGTDDSYLYGLLKRAADLGDLTIVIHTENIELVQAFRREAMERGLETLKDWSAVKPAFTEAEACVRAMYFAEHLGAKIYIPHLSTRMALDEVRRWRKRYDRIYVETCPHYLTHTEDSDLKGMGKANPPFRTADDVAAMWEGLADGSIDTVASDHCPRKRSTKDVPLWQASQGFPGTATILPVLLHHGYHQGRLSLSQIVRLLCRNPSDIFQLPQKGRLEIGYDADVTLVDINKVKAVDPEKLGSYSDYSLYEGEELKGWPQEVILRGETIMKDGEITGASGYGKYIHRVAK